MRSQSAIFVNRVDVGFKDMWIKLRTSRLMLVTSVACLTRTLPFVRIRISFSISIYRVAIGLQPVTAENATSTTTNIGTRRTARIPNLITHLPSKVHPFTKGHSAHVLGRISVREHLYDSPIAFLPWYSGCTSCLANLQTYVRTAVKLQPYYAHSIAAKL